MPKKRTNEFQKLTIAQQQEMIDRRIIRDEVSKAITELARTVLSWVDGLEISQEKFLEFFHAGGHRGEYRENPSITTRVRVLPQAGELKNLTQRLKDTPLDYMGAVELSYVYERITLMLNELRLQPEGGTAQEAIDTYEAIGTIIRQKVFVEMGHYPEEFPVPRGKITGDEELSQFKLIDHQPPFILGALRWQRNSAVSST